MRPKRTLNDPHGARRVLATAEAAACDILAGYYRVPVVKSAGLESPAAFDRAVVRLADQLRTSAEPDERRAIAAAIKYLDVDWTATTAAERARLIRRAVAAAKQHSLQISAKAEKLLAKSAPLLVGGVRNSLRRHPGLTVGRAFSALEKRMIDFLTRSHTLFVRAAGDERAERGSAVARQVVNDAMAAGLGRRETALLLAQSCTEKLSSVSGNYWEVVAGSFVGRGRAYAQVGAYAEAGIQHYRVHAVLDERTSNVCRLMHGKVLSVRDAVRQFEAAAQAPTADKILALNPWIRESNGELFVVRGSKKTALAEVSRSGMGHRDDRGEYLREPSSAALSTARIGFPPYHGLCRTTTMPEI